MAGYHEYKNEVIKLLNEGAVFANKAGYSKAAENIDKSREKLNKNELIVVVCGEIKRGKSSLLSAFLEEKDLFPIDVNVATNSVTIARYGEKETIEVVLENGGKYESKTITREEIANYTTEQGNRGNLKKVKCLHIQTPNPKLKNGLVFVDTPGVGSINLQHSEITYGYLPNADVVLFISDALSPMTESELKFLQIATDFCDNFIFPLTKIDKSSDYKEIYESNLQKIQQYTSMTKEDIQIVPVSSLAKLRYLDIKNPMMLKSSNYRALEDLIWSTVNDKRAQILFTPPLTELAKELLVIKNNLQVQHKSLTQDVQATKELESNLKKASEDRQKLLEDSAGWRGQLQYELNKVFDDSLEDIQKKQYDLQEILGNAFRDNSIIRHLEELTARINEELFSLTFNCKKNILKNVDTIVDATEQKLGLLITVSNESINTIEFDKNKEVTFDIKQKSGIDKSIMVGRNIMMSGAGGGAIGGIAGGIIGGAIGFLLAGPAGAYIGLQSGASVTAGLGSIIGSGKGALEGIKQLKAADIPQVSREYTNYMNKNLVNIRNSIMKVKKELSYAITSNLNEKIKAQKNAFDKDIKDIKENLVLSKADAEKKAKRIKESSSNLNHLEARINKLLQMIKNKVTVNRNRKTRNQNTSNNMSRQDSHSSDKFSYLDF